MLPDCYPLIMLRYFLGALCTLAATTAGAWEFVPGGNAGTLARPFALPVLGETTVLLDGRGETRAMVDVTNEYVREGQMQCPVECITVDGETTRLRLAHRQGLGSGWEWFAEVPLLDSGGGFLDGWIQDWHSWFGLPNGGRVFAADDQYHFRYERGGQVLLDQAEGASGLGDVSLGLGRSLGTGTVLRAMVKLPTGDEDKLTGGNGGGALWLDQDLPLPGRWDGYVSVGASLNQRGEVLGELQNRAVFFGGVGLLAPLSQRVRLTGQLQLHSRLYDDSQLTPLERFGAPLTLGLQFLAGSRGVIELGFQEDPSVNASPDFSVYLALTRR